MSRQRRLSIGWTCSERIFRTAVNQKGLDRNYDIDQPMAVRPSVAEGARVMTFGAAGAVRWLVGICFLVAPVVALLAVPLYAGSEPQLAGLPLFYWYQLAWVLATPVFLAVTHLIRRPRPADEPG
ncbi:DUF3311 domain-containing protein [Actinomycetes bacterium KLBMP 9759]